MTSRRSRAQMNRRAERIGLAHRAVAVILVAHQHRRKQERHGDARHQVIERQRAPARRARRMRLQGSQPGCAS